MSAEFRSLVELALSAPIHLPVLSMACADEDREPCDLHEWSNDVDSLVAAFESQGDCILSLRSQTADSDMAVIKWGYFYCMDQGGEPEELVVDFTDNEIMTKIHDAWSLVVN
jgi:hypothetical protein